MRSDTICTPNPPQRKALKKGTLASVVGIGAAAILFQVVPKEESGRTVVVDIAHDGQAKVTHVSGRQYLKTYLDVAGIPTACDGITDKQKIKMGVTYTEQDCTAFLERELVIHAEGVMRCTPAFRDHPRKDDIAPTIAATVSLAYNIGVAGYCGSSARRLFNQGNFMAACDRFLPWNKARVNGHLVVVRGLKLRRERERDLCLQGIV